MRLIVIQLTDRDRYFLSILFSLAGYLAQGVNYAPAVQLSLEAADYLKKLTKDLDVDEQ
jgi:hypothetical protein